MHRICLFLLLSAPTAAFSQSTPADAVAATVTAARGRVDKVNGVITGIDLAVPNAGPHDKRASDPYDAAFFEQLGHITTLESLNIISTKANDEWITPLSKLTRLKALRFTNNGKLTDAGLAKLAGLKDMETFSFVGTGMTGEAFAAFEGWTKLIKCSFRGSSINDAGLKAICEHFPNLESMSLAHAKFTDAGAPHLAKLTKLKGLELGSKNATTACLAHLKALPLEYLQLGDGLDSPEGIAAIKHIPSLRRCTLTHCEHLSDEGLKLATELKQLQQLEIGGLELPDARISQLAPFSFLKELKLVRRPQSYPADIQAKVKALLPTVDVKF